MSQHDPRFSYRTAVLLGMLAAASALLIQQRAMADSTPALARVQMPAPAVMALPTASAPQALAAPLQQSTKTVQFRSSNRRVMVMDVTAYCPCKKCCGPNARGVTASGKKVSHNKGAFVAADTNVLPFHTKLSIPGYRTGRVVPVIDRGGDIKGKRLDVFFATHSEAKTFGRRIVPVTIH